MLRIARGVSFNRGHEFINVLSVAGYYIGLVTTLWVMAISAIGIIIARIFSAPVSAEIAKPKEAAQEQVAPQLFDLLSTARDGRDLLQGTSFAYSLFVHSFHACRDRVVLLPPCSLYGAATLRPPPLGPGRGLTLPCGWNNAEVVFKVDIMLGCFAFANAGVKLDGAGAMTIVVAGALLGGKTLGIFMSGVRLGCEIQ